MTIHDILGFEAIKVCLGIASVGVVTALIWKKRSASKRAKLEEKWSQAGKDVVVLHQFPRARFCPNPSPFPIKIETFLRMFDIKYINDFQTPMSTKNKTPWITINGVHIADSQLAMEYLSKKFNMDTNKGLSSKDHAVSRAMRFLMEQDLYWCLVMDRWVFNWAKHVPDFFAPVFSPLPTWLERKALHYFSKMVAKQTVAQGMGRHTRPEVEEMGLKDLEALSTFLGTKKFMMGEEPTELDCAMFCFMCMILYCSPESNIYARKIKSDYSNLTQFSARMVDKFWPDWEDVCYKEETSSPGNLEFLIDLLC